MSDETREQTPSRDLVEYLRDRGLSRMDFAYSMRVSLDSVHRWCQGSQTPKPEHAEAIYRRTGGAVDFRAHPESLPAA